jgi:putative effector of murein hydrolase LrgA (UPF0299 family)
MVGWAAVGEWAAALLSIAILFGLLGLVVLFGSACVRMVGSE